MMWPQRIPTIHDSPASQVTLELVGQRRVRRGQVANGDEAVVVHRLGQFDDGNVVSAQDGGVKHCTAETEPDCRTVSSP